VLQRSTTQETGLLANTLGLALDRVSA
jgi:hypothetical protein